MDFYVDNMDDASNSYADRLLPPAVVALLLDVTPNQLAIWRMHRIGLPFIKLGEAKSAPVRYRMSDVTAFLDARTVQARRKPRPRAGRPPPADTPAHDLAKRRARCAAREMVASPNSRGPGTT